MRIWLFLLLGQTHVPHLLLAPTSSLLQSLQSPTVQNRLLQPGGSTHAPCQVWGGQGKVTLQPRGGAHGTLIHTVPPSPTHLLQVQATPHLYTPHRLPPRIPHFATKKKQRLRPRNRGGGGAAPGAAACDNVRPQLCGCNM